MITTKTWPYGTVLTVEVLSREEVAKPGVRTKYAAAMLRARRLKEAHDAIV